MQKVKAKKFLGQHFLNDEGIAKDIAHSLLEGKTFSNILEIGPGMGVLTKYLIKDYPHCNVKAVELDRESVAFLAVNFPDLEVLSHDFLKIDINLAFEEKFAIIGNYPYNISSQIVFKCIENRDQIPMMAGMFQKEVAERICSGPGSKVYGVTSVLTQAFYQAEYLFTVDETVFTPPPKVKSGVLRLTRLAIDPDCEVKLLFTVVKQAFGQRRKTLRNSLRSLYSDEVLKMEIFNDRPERLSVQQFVDLVNML